MNGHVHTSFEARLTAFFSAPAALLFDSGFNTNYGPFVTVPQLGDVLVFDEHIHTSINDRMHVLRCRQCPVLDVLKRTLRELATIYERDRLSSVAARGGNTMQNGRHGRAGATRSLRSCDMLTARTLSPRHAVHAFAIAFLSSESTSSSHIPGSATNRVTALRELVRHRSERACARPPLPVTSRPYARCCVRVSKTVRCCRES